MAVMHGWRRPTGILEVRRWSQLGSGDVTGKKGIRGHQVDVATLDLRKSQSKTIGDWLSVSQSPPSHATRHISFQTAWAGSLCAGRGRAIAIVPGLAGWRSSPRV